MTQPWAITLAADDLWNWNARTLLLQAAGPSPQMRLTRYSSTEQVLEELESEDLCARVVGYCSVQGEAKMDSYAKDASKSNA